MTTIKLKNGSGAPTAGDLAQGEPALDLTNKRLYTEDSGGTVIEVGTNPGEDVTFADNRKAIFGAGSDLQIYHDGSDSVIYDGGTGNLKLLGTNVVINNAGNTANLATFNDGSDVRLFFNGSQKLTTTSTGIDVSGSVTADGLTVDGTAQFDNYGGTTGKGRIQFGNSGQQFIEGLDTGNGGSGAYLRFGYGSTETARFDNSGNFGIGTSPSSKLHVSGSGTLEVARFETTTDNTPSIGIYSNSGVRTVLRGSTAESALLSQGSTPLLLGTNNTERMRIDASGNVGIGESSPDAKLHIRDATDGGSSSVTSAIQFSRRNGGSNDATIKMQHDGSDGVSNLQFHFGTSEAMRIDASGDVGIGTDSPSTYDSRANNLVVGDSGDAGITIFSGASNDARLQFAPSGDTGLNNGLIGYDNANDKMSFATAGSDRMHIDSSGRVGIGVTPNTNWSTASSYNTLQLRNSSLYFRSSAPELYIANNHLWNGSNWQYLSTNTAAMYQLTNNEHVWSYAASGTAGTNITYSEAMRIDASGNLLVGTTDTTLYNNTTGGGFSVSSNGFTQIAKQGADSADPVLILNQTGLDGEIQRFYKDGTIVGSIGVANSNNLYIQGDSTETGLQFGTSVILPHQGGFEVDNIVDFGSSSKRFKDLYLSGNITTSGSSFTSTTSGYFFGGAGSFANGIYGVGVNNVAINANGTERMRLDSSGNLLVGATSQPSSFRFFVDSGANSSVGIRGSSTTYNAVVFYTPSSTTAGYIQVSGSATTYNTSSDQRLKDNIVDAPSASDDIDAIQVRSFDWKADGSHQKYGMVAQELQSVAPEAVSGDADSDKMMGVDYSKLVPMLVKEIQSLRARVAQLEGAN